MHIIIIIIKSFSLDLMKLMGDDLTLFKDMDLLSYFSQYVSVSLVAPTQSCTIEQDDDITSERDGDSARGGCVLHQTTVTLTNAAGYACVKSINYRLSTLRSTSLCPKFGAKFGGCDKRANYEVKTILKKHVTEVLL